MKKPKKVYKTLPSEDEPIYEVVKDFGNVKIAGKRISGNFFRLSEETKSYNSQMKKRSDEISSNHIIGFGKYKGRKINTMTSEEEYKYCVWFYNRLKTELSKTARKKDMQYKAFSWAVRNNKPTTS